MAKDPVSSVVKTRPTVIPMKPAGAAVKFVRKATERLEEDAKEMEDRLAQLRLSMLEEKRKRDAERPAKHGGNRWRSAREDRGSVSRYAQDVQSKAKTTGSGTGKNKRTGGAGDDSTAADAVKQKKSKKRGATSDDATSQGAILSVATLATWTAKQVLEWLSAIGLEEYQSGFEYHQVTGAMLLKLTLSEYTQMGVTKLSARNTLYTEIEKIRDKSAAAAAASVQGQQQRRNAPPIEIIDSKLRDVRPEVPSPQARGGSGVHWSQLKPLADTAIAVGNGDVPVNLADGAFDEDESHTSFMKALLEWRSCDSEQVHTEDGGGVGSGSEEKEELWVNPMMSLFDDGSGADAAPSGGALLEGSYDEEKEQEAFQRAVAAWRSGSSASADIVARPASVEQIEQGCPAAQRKSCWQCYRVVTTDSLVVDEQTNKPFCSAVCRSSYCHEYSRFYDKQ